MSRKTTTWLILAVLLFLIGSILFTGAMTMLNWDFQELSFTHYETNSHTFSQPIEHLSINTNTADVVLIPSASKTIDVLCHEESRLRHHVSIQNNTLTIAVSDTRKWYDHIQLFNFATPRITVSLPQGLYSTLAIHLSTGNVSIPADFTWQSIDITASTGDVHCDASAVGALKIYTSTGDIVVGATTVGDADLNVTTGDITVTALACNGAVQTSARTGNTVLKDVSCETLMSDGSTGNLTLQNVIASDSFTIHRRTGDVHFDGCDANRITVNTSTGDVEGHFLSDKVIVANATTGDVDVPQCTTGGMCTIKTTTGNIRITIQNP